MSAYAISYKSGSPWGRRAGRGFARAPCWGSFTRGLRSGATSTTSLVGIAMIIFGSGIAFFLGKPFIQPLAPQLPGIDFGGWTTNPALKAALRICPLFFLGVVVSFIMDWFFKSTRWGMFVRAVGDRPEAARRVMGDRSVESAHVEHYVRELSGRHRRRLSLTLLPGKLDGARLRRPGFHGCGARDFRPLESGALPLGVTLLWRRARRWARRSSRSA